MFQLFYLILPLFAGLEGAGSGNSIESALSTAFNTVASDALSTIGTILPIALPILGAMIVITIGIKLFKRVSSK